MYFTKATFFSRLAPIQNNEMQKRKSKTKRNNSIQLFKPCHVYAVWRHFEAIFPLLESDFFLFRTTFFRRIRPFNRSRRSPGLCSLALAIAMHSYGQLYQIAKFFGPDFDVNIQQFFKLQFVWTRTNITSGHQWQIS